MWLVLCSPADTSALWAGRGLRARGVCPLEFTTPVELACAQTLEYSAGAMQPASGTAQLGRGLRIETPRLRGTLNRAMPGPSPQASRAAAGDRAYVQGEMDAILTAWLSALPGPVLNPAGRHGWCGALRHPFEWALLAQKAGFETPPYRCGHGGLEYPPLPRNPSAHLILHGRAFPELPKPLAGAAVRLADLAEMPLMGLTLDHEDPGLPRFASADPLPDLRVGGSDFLDALAAAFKSP